MLDLQELERKLDAALATETPESLREWLHKQRLAEQQEDRAVAEPELEPSSVTE